MPTYIGENKIVDRYLGDKFLEAAYIGDKKVYDPYTEITGYLPMIFKSRAAVALKNYRIHGTSEGAGVETENVWDAQSASLTFIQVASAGSMRWAFTITEPGIYTLKCFDNRRGYVYCRRYNVSTDKYGTFYPLSVPEGAPESPQTATLEVDSDIILLIYQRDTGTADDTATLFNLTKLCVVSGSTIPTTYIPHGYKLPLMVESGETENLFGVEWKQGVYAVRDGIYAVSSQYICTDIGISVTPDTQYSFKIFDSYSINYFFVLYYDLNENYLKKYKTFTGVKQGTFTTSSECYYIKINLNSQAGIIPNNINEVILVKGSTPPDHYIPNRYTSDIPIYIGDSKLGEEEYVDYGEKKVYKRTGNLWDGTSIVSLPGGGESRLGIYVEPGKKYAIINSTNRDMIIGENNFTSRLIACRAGQSNVYDIRADISNAGFALTGTETAYEGQITIIQSDTIPSAHIPYLQPTDPPVPLTPIPTYKGENTLDTETAPNVFDYSSLVMGSINVPGGEEVTSNTHKRTPYIEVDAGSIYILQSILSGGAIRIHQYTSSSSAGWTRSDLYHEGDSISLDATTKYVRMVATVDTYQSDTYFGLGKYGVGTVTIKGRIKEIT